MAFQARQVMQAASTILQDVGTVRWTAAELLDHLNAGVREIVTRKPTASTKHVSLSLVSGTLQTLPAAYTMLCDVTRNLTAPHPNPVGGGSIRVMASRSLMDQQIPDWQDSASLPFAKRVIHVIPDAADPRAFLVVPGNDGTGMIEAIVGFMPTAVAAPSGAAALETSNYTGEVPLPDAYRNALVEYVLHRAFAKDAGVPGAAERAVAHLNLFTDMLGAIGAGEAALSLSARAG